MKQTRLIVLTVLCFFAVSVCTAVPVFAVDPVMEKVLPAGDFSKDWVSKDKAVFHNQDTLFEHINGEAELYMPYGFELLATETFINRNNADAWLVADVYKMASSLDSFGIYSNYRKADYEKVNIGGDGFISPTQLMFHQDRYFVRLQVTGINSLEKRIFLDLGRAISEKLPAGSAYPREIAAMGIPEAIPRSERYIAQGLLGYAFFRRGMTADAGLPGERPRIFVVLEDSPDAALKVLQQYQGYLKAEGQDAEVKKESGGFYVSAGEPLYGSVFAMQADRYVIGVVGAKKTPAVEKIVEALRSRLVSLSSLTSRLSIARVRELMIVTKPHWSKGLKANDRES